MMTGGWSKPVGANSPSAHHMEQINVKAKRKIKSGTDCRIVLSASVDGEIVVTGILRALLLLNN